MGRFVRGDVVTVPWPMAKGGAFKKRPAIVLSEFDYGSAEAYVLCSVSATQHSDDASAISLGRNQFKTGSLSLDSWARPRFLFTVHDAIIDRRVATLSDFILNQVIAEARKLLD